MNFLGFGVRTYVKNVGLTMPPISKDASLYAERIFLERGDYLEAYS
jgi:hypothetical protein